MNWTGYITSSSLSEGTIVEVSRFLVKGELPSTPKAGDSLTIEFPNNNRAGGIIESASQATVVVDINGASSTWEQQGSHQINADDLLSLSYVVK